MYSFWGLKMTSDKLENLVGIGQLKKEPPSATELAGLRRSGASRPKNHYDERFGEGAGHA